MQHTFIHRWVLQADGMFPVSMTGFLPASIPLHLLVFLPALPWAPRCMAAASVAVGDVALLAPIARGAVQAPRRNGGEAAIRPAHRRRSVVAVRRFQAAAQAGSTAVF